MVLHASSRIIRREINLDVGDGDGADGSDGGDGGEGGDGGGTSGQGVQDTHSSHTHAGQVSAQVETAAAATVTGGVNEDGWATHLDTSTNRWYRIHSVTGESRWT